MSEYLFSYGTLQKESVQLELFGRLLSGTKDVLEGYKIAFIEIKDEAFLAKGEDKFQKTLIPSTNSDLIEGTALELSQTELFQADKYEPENYRRIKVKLKSGRNAWIYMADSAQR